MLQSKGIIFRTTKFRETSLIADIFTEEKGLHSFFMNGVYSAKSSRLISLLQVGNLIDFVSYYSDKKELHRIKEVNPDYIYSTIPNEIFKSAISTFIIELCRHCIRDQFSNKELFSFIKRCLVLLDHQEKLDPNFHLKFMVKLSNYLGFQANNNYSSINNSFDLLNAEYVPYKEMQTYLVSLESSQQLSKLMMDEYQSEKTFHIQYEDRNRLLHFLLQYYKIHVDYFGELKSPAVYKSIL